MCPQEPIAPGVPVCAEILPSSPLKLGQDGGGANRLEGQQIPQISGSPIQQEFDDQVWQRDCGKIRIGHKISKVGSPILWAMLAAGWHIAGQPKETYL